MARLTRQAISDRNRPDWRGWIALAWIIFWGWAYALMAIQARSPQVAAWIRTVARMAFPHGPG